jgi:hypothetical protein
MLKSTIAVLALLTLLGAARPTAAQVSPDSVAAWTARLQTGTLEARAGAAGKLAAQDPGSLPASTRAALIAELRRVNRALAASGRVAGAPELGGEAFAEYYLDLVIPVAHFRTREAAEALVHSVGVGRGVQRRVARHGDAVIPELAGMVERGQQAGDALETLALAWFWADSARAPLSSDSEAAIVSAFLRASTSADYRLLRSSADAFLLSADPALLPLAEFVQKQAEERGHRLVASAIRQRTAPQLARLRDASATSELAARVARTTAAVCRGAAERQPRTACEGVQSQLAAAHRELAGGRVPAARASLRSAAEQADRALAARTLSRAEHALLGGGARLLLDRL